MSWDAMRTSQKRKWIENFEMELKLLPVDNEYQVMLKCSDRLVFEKEAFIGIQMLIKRLVDHLAGNALSSLDENIQDAIKDRLRNEEGVYFEKEVNNEFINEHFDEPVKMNDEGQFVTIQTDEYN